MRVAKGLLVVVFVIIVLAGCGSSSKDSDSMAYSGMSGSMEQAAQNDSKPSSNLAFTTSRGEQDIARDSDNEMQPELSSDFNSSSLIGNEQDSAFNRKIIYTAN